MVELVVMNLSVDQQSTDVLYSFEQLTLKMTPLVMTVGGFILPRPKVID